MTGLGGMPVPGGTPPKRKLPGWGWALISVAGVAIVALVVTLVLVNISGSGGDDVDVTESDLPSVGDLSLSDSVALSSDPRTKFDRGDWNSAGVYFADSESARQAQYRHPELTCIGVAITFADVRLGDAADDREATEAFIASRGFASTATATGTVTTAVSNGGSIEMLTYVYPSSDKYANNMVAVRAFAGSSHAVMYVAACEREQDLASVNEEFLDRVSVELERKE